MRPATATAAALLVVLSGCSTSPRAQTAPTPPTTVVSRLKRVKKLTALGDSVPAGSACNCAPFPQLHAADVTRISGQPVATSNAAVPGYTSRKVVDQLDNDATVIDDVAHSQSVIVEIGANDVSYSSACGTNVACYAPRLPSVTSNLTAIVKRIRELAPDPDVGVTLLDYWNVWLGGKYAAARGPAYVAAADELTDQIDDAIHTVATATGCVYVDLRAAFRGPDHSRDETDLLAPDGDHPNAAGHRRIAAAIAQSEVDGDG